ncbi:E3 ubiquitin-protein ligase rnf8-A-like isoform X1 [Bufo bufo]|uniref:E3 ubiquitin-protein ligase rnf8-A-like isoform X1 n=1 Tax=Bufo bufo TaxID=8384 RepID=UPI001ABDC487|nr:E3 ubiquitin-protein ligase rnf8-A-like isoform X1 [Bufo bufo]
MEDTGDGMSGGTCWCLRRLGSSRDILLLPEGEEVTLGRAFTTYQLQSTLCPLMVSRVHCIFKQNAEGQWTITDNNSLNGVFLNKQKLEPQKPYVVTRGSCVQVGVALPNTEQAEFEYELVQENLEQIRPHLTPQSGKRKSTRTKRKLNCEDSEASGTEGTSGTSRAKIHRVSKDCREPTRSRKTEMAKQPTVKVEAVVDLESSMDADMMAPSQTPSQSNFHLTKMRQSIVELRDLNAQVQEKLKIPEQSGSTGSRQPASTQQQLQDLQKELCSKHEEHLQRVSELKKVFQEEQGSTGKPSQAEEEPLGEQLAQALKEHSLLMEDLNRSRRDFEQIIQAKNKELQETKEDKEKVAAQKEEVFNHMNDVLDNELQCIICSEHFIEAVTLNCAHSFCCFCIQSWRKRKEECPICRQEITTQTRSLVLDNCINRMVDKLSPEMQDRRLALILERKDQAAETLLRSIPVSSDSEGSPLPSDIILSSSEEADDLLQEDILWDSEDSHYSFSDEDIEDQGDLFSDDDDDDDDDFFFMM